MAASKVLTVGLSDGFKRFLHLSLRVFPSKLENGCFSTAPPGSSPVAVHVQYDVRGADGDGHLVPLVISQAVGEHLGVGLLASGAVVKTHLAALAAALQLQEPAGGQAAAVISPRAAGVVRV